VERQKFSELQYSIVDRNETAFMDAKQGKGRLNIAFYTFKEYNPDRKLRLKMKNKNSDIQKINEEAYCIEDLIQICRESKWEELTKLADTFSLACDEGTVCSDGSTKQVRYDIRRLLDSLVLKSCPDLIRPRHGYSEVELLGLVAAPDGKYSPSSPSKYLPRGRDSGGSAKDDSKLETILRKTTKAFATSETLEGVLRKVSSTGNYKRFMKDFTEYHSKEEWEKYLTIKITPECKYLMGSLYKGLSDRAACEKEWWNRATVFFKPLIQILLEIKKQIDVDTPLKKDQIEMLNIFMGFGRAFGRIIHDDQGETYELVLMSNSYEREPCSMSVVSDLLVQPAYALARKLEQKHSKPRFVRQCRAPSCRKRFWTGRKNATNCPGSPNGKKNDCSLQWNRFKRFILKIGKNPEKHWDSEKLQQQFIDYDNS